jgi:hypothetical protein
VNGAPVLEPATFRETTGRRARAIELVAFFVLAPLAASRGPRWCVLPTILVAGAVCLTLLLRDPTFRRHHLGDWASARRRLPRLMTRVLLVWAGLLVFTVLTKGSGGLFQFPRAHPRVWMGVALLYPVFSVYPQEVMYRTFFFHRYTGLFRTPQALIVTNAVLFGWGHILVHNAVAMGLCTLGGVLLATTYRRSPSTVLVALEHALYGDFVFSVGVGGMFVNGVRLLSSLAR